MNEEAQGTEATAESENWLTVGEQVDATPPEGSVEAEEAAQTEPEEKAEAEDTAPEGETADQPDTPGGDTDTDEGAADADKGTDQFTLKHLDETRTVSRNEVVELAQKGMDYDRIRQKYDEQTSSVATITAAKDAAENKVNFLEEFSKSAGYRGLDDMIDDIRASQIAEQTGVDKATAIRQVQLDRKEQAIAEKEKAMQKQTAAQTSAADAQKQAEAKRDADFAEFAKSEYGGTKPEDIPKEVWDLYAKGNCTLVQAMAQNENAQLKQQLAALKEQNAAKEKNADNKQRSTGSRRTAGAGQKSDPWAEAWANSD